VAIAFALHLIHRIHPFVFCRQEATARLGEEREAKAKLQELLRAADRYVHVSVATTSDKAVPHASVTFPP